MKVIDDKGMIFGKINIIDFLVVLFLLLLTPMFYFGQRLTEDKKVVFEKARKVIRVKAVFTNIIPELAGQVKEGDVSRDPEGKAVGNLVKIISSVSIKPVALSYLKYDPVGNYIYIDDYAKAEADDSSRNRNLTVLLDLECVEERASWYFRDYNIKIGNSIAYISDWYSLSGGIITGLIDK
jgi:hypothetical protein